MSYFLRLFCQSNQAITRREIVEFILEGVFFERDPKFLPDVKDSELDNSSWSSLHIQYDSEKRPIIFTRTLNAEKIQTEIREILEELTILDAHPEIKRRLQDTVQVLAIEIDPVGITEDAFDMPRSFGSLLYPLLDGMIYTPDDGLYDAKLGRILELT